MGAGAFAGGSNLWPMIAMLGTSVLGSAMAPDGQELQTFEGEGDLDPKHMLGESRSQLNDMISLLKQRANQPVTLRSSYAQHLPVFTGGGLPMPIGAYGVDPALNDPSLLSTSGSSGLLGAKVGGINERYNPPRGSGEDPNIPQPRSPGDAPVSHPYASTMPMRRGAGTSLFADPAAQGGNGDDLAQGAASVELLLRSLNG